MGRRVSETTVLAAKRHASKGTKQTMRPLERVLAVLAAAFGLRKRIRPGGAPEASLGSMSDRWLTEHRATYPRRY